MNAFGIAAEHNRDVAQIAIHSNALGSGDHEVGSRRALFLGTVFRVGADVDDFLGIAPLVHHFVAIVKQIVQVADDRAKIFSGGDGAPPSDGMESHGHGFFGQQRRRLVRFHFIGMVDAQDEKGDSIRDALAVLARPRSGREFVCAQNVLGPEIAGTQTVDAGKEPRHLVRRNGGEIRFRDVVLRDERLGQRRPDFPAHGVVSRHGLVRALENDDVALAGQRPDDGGLRERPEDVQVNRANFGVAPLPQIVNGRLDIFSRRAERHKYSVRVLRLIFSDQAIVAAGQLSEIFVGFFQEVQESAP